MFETILIICLLKCGPAPVAPETFSTQAACQARVVEMVAETVKTFKRYGVPFMTAHKCRHVVQA